MNLITIKESHYASDLMVLKTKLESEDIKCVIKDENTAQILTHIPSMSAKLQVYDTDIEKVKQILKENGESLETIPEVSCKYCGSAKVGAVPGSFDKFMTFINYANEQLLFSNSKPFKNRSFICENCGKRFKVS